MVTVNGSIKAWEKCDVDLCVYSIHPSDNFIRFAIKKILGIFSTGLQQNWFEIVTVNDQCMEWSWTVRADWTLHNSFLCCKLPRNSSLHEAYIIYTCMDQTVDKHSKEYIWWVKAIQFTISILKFAKYYGGNILRILLNIASSHPFLIPSISDQEPRNSLDSYSYSQGLGQKFTSQSYSRFKPT